MRRRALSRYGATLDMMEWQKRPISAGGSSRGRVAEGRRVELNLALTTAQLVSHTASQARRRIARVQTDEEQEVRLTSDSRRAELCRSGEDAWENQARADEVWAGATTGRS